MMNGIYYQKIVGRWDMRHRLTEKSLLYGDLVTTLRPELLCLMWLPLFMFLLVSHLSQLTNFLTENIKIQHIITTGHSRSDYTFHILYIYFYVKFFHKHKLFKKTIKNYFTFLWQRLIMGLLSLMFTRFFLAVRFLVVRRVRC